MLGIRIGHANQPLGTTPARNASIASRVSPGRSRWGAYPQSSSHRRVTGPATPRSIASSCAAEPFVQEHEGGARAVRRPPTIGIQAGRRRP